MGTGIGKYPPRTVGTLGTTWTVLLGSKFLRSALHLAIIPNDKVHVQELKVLGLLPIEKLDRNDWIPCLQGGIYTNKKDEGFAVNCLDSIGLTLKMTI